MKWIAQQIGAAFRLIPVFVKCLFDWKFAKHLRIGMRTLKKRDAYTKQRRDAKEAERVDRMRNPEKYRGAV